MKINITTPTQTENGIHAVITVTNDTTEIMSRHIDASDYEDLRAKLTDIKTKVESDAVELAKVSVGEFTAFVVEVAQTQDEIKAQEIASKRIELDQELDRAKKDAEIAQLAKTDADLAAKLGEFNALGN